MQLSKVSSIAFVILFIQSCYIMASPGIEKQKYRIVQAEKEFEIRFYPSATLATVYSSANSYRDLSVPGFRKLAGYIFGGNESGTKISMTSPVHMDLGEKGSSMSFVMPSAYDMDNLPKQNNPGVHIEKTEDEYAAVIRFGGYASDRRISKYADRLGKLLEERGIEYHGNFRFLGYNPPYQFIGRKNEIIVGLHWTE